MPQALQFVVLTFAGWLSRHQQDLIDCLQEENRFLREQIDGRQLRLTDAQRRRLAVRGKALGGGALARVAGIVTPDTILRWHRRLIARKPPRSPNLNAYAERFVRSTPIPFLIGVFAFLEGLFTGNVAGE